MFPYAIHVPKNLKQFVPQLKTLIQEHDCMKSCSGKDGTTTILLHFKSEQLRSEFAGDMVALLPSCSGLGTRLVATAE